MCVLHSWWDQEHGLGHQPSPEWRRHMTKDKFTWKTFNKRSSHNNKKIKMCRMYFILKSEPRLGLTLNILTVDWFSFQFPAYSRVFFFLCLSCLTWSAIRFPAGWLIITFEQRMCWQWSSLIYSTPTPFSYSLSEMVEDRCHSYSVILSVYVLFNVSVLCKGPYANRATDMVRSKLWAAQKYMGDSHETDRK